MAHIEIIDKILHSLTAGGGGAGPGGVSHALNSFANFGLHEVGHVITQYGGQSHTSGLWEIVAAIYIISKFGPKYLMLFYIGYRFLKSRVYAILVSVFVGSLWIYLSNYLLALHPTPVKQFERVSYGPSKIGTAFTTLLHAHPFKFMTIASTLIVFFVISYLMWYFINFFLYAVTSMFMMNPLFSQSSGKGHAMTFTVMWFFYLGIQSGFHAFISVMFLLATIIMGRIDMGKQVNNYVPQGVQKAARGEDLNNGSSNQNETQQLDDDVWKR